MVDNSAFDRDNAVKKFRDYLRIKSVHPNPDYASAVDFLVEYAKELQLEFKRVEVGKNRKIIVIMTLPGNNPNLSSILLNSHMDVVPVFLENWKCDPWAAIKDDNGDIYGRGAQDMKSVGIQYLEAIRILTKINKMSFERTIHLTFVPDEEIGGGQGMSMFLDTPEFEAMNVGLALDEGLANPGSNYSVYYGERSPWWTRVICRGNPGHGSRFIQNTAAEKLQKVMDSFLEFRKTEEKRLNCTTCMCLGDVTSVNLTMLQGGVQPNVVPEEFAATFDIRIPPTVDLKDFENKISKWCEQAGKDVTFEFLQKSTIQSTTKADDTNPWWKAFTSTLKKRGVEVTKEIFSGATDGRYLRERGYPVIGFSPMRNTPVLLHDNNEFLNENVFIEGIDVYCDIIPAIANLKF
uniref:aminoacylase-1A-like n=1 Tax=Styela clava TaxID=7725 RepID=UPI00193AC44C|nr:aminoacylase-1A-like [Styela clava]